ncbi:hypothetical protein D3C80_1138640 [compost metagenome]
MFKHWRLDPNIPPSDDRTEGRTFFGQKSGRILLFIQPMYHKGCLKAGQQVIHYWGNQQHFIGCRGRHGFTCQ